VVRSPRDLPEEETMRKTWLFVTAALACAAATGSASADAGEPSAIVAAHPAIVRLGGFSKVTVSGVAGASLEVRLPGATTTWGTSFGWRPLVRGPGGWFGTLPRPALRGVYPIEIRTGRGPGVLTSRRWLLRVLAPGTLARPALATPLAVARWWVATAPARESRLVAFKRWPLPDSDRRDPRLHRLLVIAYSRVGDRRVRDRLGIWITAFRTTLHGRWRLLEATVEPPG
jgi:hypothetical protein